MKILYYGDSPTVSTGFGVVAKNLLTRFRKAGHEVFVLGINHYGDPYDPKKFDFPIWPCDRGNMDMVYGYAKFWHLEKEIQPDLIFLLNDSWVIEKLWDFKPKEYKPAAKIVAYYPVDAPPMQESWLELLNSFDAQVCYTHFAEDVVISSNKMKRPKNLHQIYHGVDTKNYFPINTAIARTKLHLPVDAFIVGMVARNQYRKRFDILVRAFAEFAKNKDPKKVKLYLHTALHDVGFDIPNLIRQFKLEDNLIVTKDLTPASGVPDSTMNFIYNAFDVNVLLSMGDGFGLPVAESMAVGCPQLVSGHSALQELVDNHGGLTVNTVDKIMNVGGFNTWGYISDWKDAADKLEQLYKDEELRVKYGTEAYNFITQPQFDWETIASEFLSIFNELLHIKKFSDIVFDTLAV